jgi:hypothetical protein
LSIKIVSYGGGVNSTAMLIGLNDRGIQPDLILFTDTGGERPDTYAYIETVNEWLSAQGFPLITIVKNVDKDGNRLTLERECLKSGTLPALAYGHRGCSLKHKRDVQDKYCNNWQPCINVWNSGGKCIKFIGYDAGEERRRTNAYAYDIQDKKYEYQYPLIDCGWFREDCIKAIQKEGLPIPGKSSCFFCPSMKKSEILELYKKYPDLLQRALAIEDNARPNLLTVKGLGRDWAWRDLIEDREGAYRMCGMDDGIGIPCGCYDG